MQGIPVKEKDIQNAILDWLCWQNYVKAWPARTTGLFDPVSRAFRPIAGHTLQGVSDIMLIVKPIGRMGALEVKTPRELEWVKKNHDRLVATEFFSMKTPSGKPREKDIRHKHQIEFIKSIIAHGGFGGFVSSIDDVAGILNYVRKENGTVGDHTQRG